MYLVVTGREVDFVVSCGVSFFPSLCMSGRYGVDQERTFVVDDRSGRLVCRVIFRTVIFTYPEMFVSVSRTGCVRRGLPFFGHILNTIVLLRLTTLWWFPSEIEKSSPRISFTFESLLSMS